MNTTSPAYTIWLLGVEKEEEAFIRSVLGAAYCITLMDHIPQDILNKSQTGMEAQGDWPMVCFWGSQFWQMNLSKFSNEQMDDLLEKIPSVLIVNSSAQTALLEAVMGSAFQRILRIPLNEIQVLDVVFRVREQQNLLLDMDRMSQEVVLTRELFERKSNALSFLLSFMTAVDHASSLEGLVRESSRCFAEFFQIRNMHLAWWGPQTQISLVLDVCEGGASVDEWRNVMIANALRFSSRPMMVESCMCCGQDEHLPEHGKTLFLPLMVGDEVNGLMALPFAKALLPGKDMSMALDCARNHLALILEKRFGFSWDADQYDEYLNKKLA